MITRINGRERRCLDARDRGLAYGDGLFETMRVIGGEIRLLDLHLDRLVAGCRRLFIAAPPLAPLRAELEGCAAPCNAGALKLIVTRGVGTRGYRPDGHERATRVMTLSPLTLQTLAATRLPVRLRVCRTPLSTNTTLAGLKTLNRLDSVLARSEWRDARIWEGLMRDSDGHWVCGTMSNLFARLGSTLVTPRLDRGGIAGVMRRWVLDNAHALELRPREERVSSTTLSQADEIFMTNAIAGIVPVRAMTGDGFRLKLVEHGAADALRQRLERLPVTKQRR